MHLVQELGTTDAEGHEVCVEDACSSQVVVLLPVVRKDKTNVIHHLPHTHQPSDKPHVIHHLRERASERERQAKRERTSQPASDSARAHTSFSTSERHRSPPVTPTPTLTFLSVSLPPF